MFRKITFAIFTILSLFISNQILAQKAVQLTNIETGKKLKPITTGTRVIYVLNAADAKTPQKAITGILSEVTPTTLTVNGVTFNISDLKSFGTRKKGYGIGSFLLGGFGTAFIVSGIKMQTEDPVKQACSGCYVVSETSNSSIAGTILLSGIGLGMNILSINKTVKNSARNLKKWEMEIIDAD